MFLQLWLLSAFLIQRLSLSFSEVLEQTECWLMDGVKIEQTFWQLSLQNLIMFNQNHARYLPSVFHHISSKIFQRQSKESLLSLLIFFHTVESLHKGGPYPWSCLSLAYPNTCRMKSNSPLKITFWTSPPPVFLVRSAQLSNSPGEDQPSFCWHQTSAQVLINTKSVSWEKTAALTVSAGRRNTRR